MRVKKLSRIPPRLLLDLNGTCNLRCKMCMVHADEKDADNRFGTPARRRVMDLNNLERVLDEVKGDSPLVWTSLNGEPLLGPQYKEAVTRAKSKGLCVITHTNGLLLDQQFTEFMVNVELDVLSCSIDALTSKTYAAVRRSKQFETVRNNVLSFLQVRGNLSFPRVEVSFTRTEDNTHEESGFIDFWGQHVDVIRINGTVSTHQQATLTIKPLPEKRIPCPSLYETMPLFFNGDVGLCCRDPFCNYKMGNVFAESIEKVWHTGGFSRMRELHEAGQWDTIPLCKDCDSWAAQDYEEELTDRFLIRRSFLYSYYNVRSRLNNWTGKIAGTHKSEYEMKS